MDVTVNLKDILNRCLEKYQKEELENKNFNIQISLKDIFEKCLHKCEKDDFVNENIKDMVRNYMNDSQIEEFLTKMVKENFIYDEVIDLLPRDYLGGTLVSYFSLKYILREYINQNSYSDLINELQSFGIKPEELKM